MRPSQPAAVKEPLQNTLLRAEQVRLLYGGLPMAVFSNVLLASLLVGVLWPVVSSTLASWWLALMAVVLVVRVSIYVHYRRAGSKMKVAVCLRQFRAGAITTGVFWGAAALFLFPAVDITHQVFLAFVLAGVSAGAITSLSPDRISALGFVLPALLPLLMNFLRAGGTMPLSMGFMVALFIVFLALAAARMQRNLHENMRLRAEAIEQQDALRESEARFRLMADGAPALIWISDKKNLGIWYNKRWLDFTGRTSEQEAGLGWTAGIHPEDLQRSLESFSEAFNAQSAFEIEFRLRRADGSYGWIADSGIPQFKLNGEFTGYIGYCWDITDRKQAEMELRLQHQLGEVIVRVQSEFISELDRRVVFDGLLKAILLMTESEYGFMGEVLLTSAGEPYLKNSAYTNIVWNEAPRSFDEGNSLQDTELSRLKNLIDAAMSSGEPVIANDPFMDPRREDKHDGQTASNFFLLIPVRHNGVLVAMLGIINRPGGYDQAMIDFLHPLLVTLGQMIVAARIQQRHREDQIVLARLSQVASQTTNGVIITDLHGGVEWVNEGFTRMTGYSLEEMRGRHPGALLQGNDTDPATTARMRAAMAQGNPFDEEVLNYNKDGTSYWVHISCNPMRDSSGVQQGFIAIESDISERKRMERMKSEFVSTVSHELRTPLTAISAALGLITGGAAGELPAAVQKLLDIAQKNGLRLTYLINDLLDIEKLTAGKLVFNMQTQALIPLIVQALEANRDYGVERGVRLELTDGLADIYVQVDSQRLMQVFSNLLSNAVKYSPQDETVEVKVEQRGKSVRVTVTDHGHGIPQAFRARIFQKFAQADSSDTRQKGGTGLGLAITRELVEHMGGAIGFDSVEGEGASFYVEFPVCSAPA